jgi:hypothetical protein
MDLSPPRSCSRWNHLATLDGEQRDMPTLRLPPSDRLVNELGAGQHRADVSPDSPAVHLPPSQERSHSCDDGGLSPTRGACALGGGPPPGVIPVSAFTAEAGTRRGWSRSSRARKSASQTYRLCRPRRWSHAVEGSVRKRTRRSRRASHHLIGAVSHGCHTALASSPAALTMSSCLTRSLSSSTAGSSTKASPEPGGFGPPRYLPDSLVSL